MCARRTAGRNSKQLENANIPVWVKHTEEMRAEKQEGQNANKRLYSQILSGFYVHDKSELLLI